MYAFAVSLKANEKLQGNEFLLGGMDACWMLTPRRTTREKLASRDLGGEAELNTYLEGYYGEGHHGGPNHGQGVLPP